MSQNSPVVLWSNIPDLRKSFNIPLSFIIKEKDLSKELYEFEQRMVYFNDTVQKEKETLDDIKQQSLKDSEAGKSNESTFYNLKQEEGRIDRCMFFVKDYIKEIMGYYYIVSVQFNKKSEEECKKELQKALGRRKNKQPVRHKFS